MLSVLTVVERSISQWHEILKTAGLKVKTIHTYDDDIGRLTGVGKIFFTICCTNQLLHAYIHNLHLTSIIPIQLNLLILLRIAL